MLWINSYVPIKCWDLFQGRGSRLLCILDPMPRQFSSPVIHPHLHFPTQVPATLPSGYFSISEPAPDHWTHRYFVVWHHRQPRIPSTNLWEKCKPLPAHPCCPCPTVIAWSQRRQLKVIGCPGISLQLTTRAKLSIPDKITTKEPKIWLKIVLYYYMILHLCSSQRVFLQLRH